MIIGAQVADFEVPIFGKSGSVAEKYASENHYLFKTDLTTALNSIERKKAEIKLVQNKSFDIFGEKVSVSNTLSRYHDMLEYYNSRYDDFLKLSHLLFRPITTSMPVQKMHLIFGLRKLTEQ